MLKQDEEASKVAREKFIPFWSTGICAAVFAMSVSEAIILEQDINLH